MSIDDALAEANKAERVAADALRRSRSDEQYWMLTVIHDGFQTLGAMFSYAKQHPGKPIPLPTSALPGSNEGILQYLREWRELLPRVE